MKLTSIEAARGIAAIMVVFYHAANHMQRNIGYLPLGGIAQFGHAGVDFFFVLSGFIIYYVHSKDVNNPSRLINYIERRFARVYPLYWFVIVLALVLDLIFAKSIKSNFWTIAGSFTLYPTLFDPYIGVAWTLQHEIIFYSVFAIAIANGRLGFVIFFAWLVAILMSWCLGYTNHHNALTNKMLSFYSLEFFFGIFAAWVTLKTQTIPNVPSSESGGGRMKNKSKNLSLMLGVLIFLMFGISENIGMYDINSIYARLGYGLSSMMIVVGLAGMGEMNKTKISKALSILGSASYSIYLTHLIFIGILYKILELSGLFLSFYVWFTYLLLSLSGILGGVIISRLIEHSLTDLTRVYISRVKLLVKNVL